MRVVLFDLDCIRDDHLGCYGYGRDTSPNIDSLSADASRFTSCYTSNAPWMRCNFEVPGGRKSMSPMPSNWSAPFWSRIVRESVRDDT